MEESSRSDGNNSFNLPSDTPSSFSISARYDKFYIEIIKFPKIAEIFKKINLVQMNLSYFLNFSIFLQIFGVAIDFFSVLKSFLQKIKILSECFTCRSRFSNVI